MARAYSDDLRCKFLQAYARGGVTLRQLAERFGVSLQYGKKVRQHQLRTGQMERSPQSRYGPISRVTTAVEAQLREQVRATPDATLAELGEVMWRQRQIRLSRSHVGRLLVRLGLRLKKNRSTPPNKTRKKAVSGGRRGGNR